MRIPIEFVPSGAVVWVEPGTTVLEASRATTAPISAPCGGAGVCAACGVRVLTGELLEPDSEERAVLKRAPKGIRLACRARVAGPVTVRPIFTDEGLRVEAAASGGQSVVAAVDLGTTTVTAVALDPHDGRELGRATTMNLQRAFGADVLSRVSCALAGEAERLRRAAEESVLSALAGACPDFASISRLVIVANTAMASLLAGADVSSLATAPFSVPEKIVVSTDSGLRSALGSGVCIELIEPLAAFVGGDVVAGIAAVLGEGRSGHSLLVDVGTNAEVALISDSGLLIASAPAGPAFEGSGIACGGLAVPGAVSAVAIECAEVNLSTIGGESPLWLSGAGLVSAIAALRRAGHLAPDGAFVREGPLEARFSQDEDGVTRVALGTGCTDLWLTQLDIRAFQLAKAAIRVAVESTLMRAHVSASELRRVWVAGAFGSALDRCDLVEIGMLPSSAFNAIRLPGNTALQGAVSFALDPEAVSRSLESLRDVSVVDLPGDPEFGSRLLSAVSLTPFDV